MPTITSGSKKTLPKRTAPQSAEALYPFEAGEPHPLGATPTANGVNFSVFSRFATGVDLLIFDSHNSPEPVQVISLDPATNKTFHFWHVFVQGLKPGAHYAYRVQGPFDPANGHRFNARKVVIDPYAKGNTTTLWNRANACGEEDNLHTSMRSVVIDIHNYDWEDDQPLNRPMSESIIYEMHVGGFTRHKNSKVKHPGTFKGVIEKIPYLKELGVTAVELLPVFEFDDTEVLRIGPDDKPLTNYWGYSTISFFAPDSQYCVSPEQATHINEFRDMVKALHKAGIEVILDVVFNHTSEGNHEGPTINFKAFDNSLYYHLVSNDKQYYMDYSGCGNTVNCNHPITNKFIVECLEFWVKEMHVDGFRFDEGSILSRGEDGAPMAHPPVIWNIELSETLADTKIIAEAWDAAGLYQIGYFPGTRWAEWNGRFRDDVRRFVKGDPGFVGAVASRIAGSSDVYEHDGREPVNSVNFVTCHDGFTLNDLVSFDEKQNEANGEGNRDGVNENFSWNCGAEGPTNDAGIEALRLRQCKNFAAILLLSQGVPMITMGDEARRTQNGNNNAYCQDNEISWFDWSLTTKHSNLFNFFKRMIQFRKNHPTLQRNRFFTGEVNERGLADISWHGAQLYNPGWNDLEARALAFTLGGMAEDADIHVMMNMHWEAIDFEVPAVIGRTWYKAVDTAQESSHDIYEPGEEPPFQGNTCQVAARSIVVLISKTGGKR